MSASKALTGAEIRIVLTNAICDYDEKNMKHGGPLFPTNALSYLMKHIQIELDGKGKKDV